MPQHWHAKTSRLPGAYLAARVKVLLEELDAAEEGEELSSGEEDARGFEVL